MVLTNAQIKTILDGITFPETVIIHDHVQNPNIRKFTAPFVEIENRTPEDISADIRTTTTEQQFLIHLFMRTVAAGTQEEARLSTLENLIRVALDGATLGGTKLFVEDKAWARNQRQTPVQYSESILTVLVSDIADTSGAGTIGAEITLTLPSLAAMQVLNMPIGLEIELNEDILDDTNKRVQLGPLGETDQRFYEVEYTDARRDQLRVLKNSRAIQAVTVTRPSASENFNGKITQMSTGGTYEGLQTIVIQIDVIN